MSRRLVIRTEEVAGFSPAGAEDSYVSRMLVDRESVGSDALVVNHFTLRPGKRTAPGHHPSPYDEVYYVLRGRGVVGLGDPPEGFELEPDTVVFIPSGTTHAVENTGAEDLVMLTVMPQQLVQGANALYDERRRTWGSSFKLAKDL
jgi:mannose-6-phosphate isomerase-like protein (cupin superfamily)